MYFLIYFLYSDIDNINIFVDSNILQYQNTKYHMIDENTIMINIWVGGLTTVYITPESRMLFTQNI